MSTIGSNTATLEHCKKVVQASRPKLLFLACYFPPAHAIASIRAWNIAKYLARMGWDVTVVTPDPSVWLHVEEPAKIEADIAREGIRRINTGHRWRHLSPDHLRCRNRGIGWILGGLCRKVARYLGIDAGIGWISEAERACARLSPNTIDVILATGNPFSSFTLAKRLSDRFQRPYVLDYRDAWQPSAETPPSVRRTIRRREQDLMKASSAVSSISTSLLGDRPALQGKLHVITNGFDPEEMARIRPYEFGHFAIVYAGIFCPPQRVITPVMAGLRLLKGRTKNQNPYWMFHYYGMEVDHVREEAARFGVLDKVVMHGRVSRTAALSAIRGAGVSIVITSVLENQAVEDRGIVTGKLFDALGLGVPILVITPSESDVEAIIKTSGLAQSVRGSNTDGIVSFLEAVMLGKAPKARSPEVYAWPNIIKKLDTILKSSLEKGSTARLHGEPTHRTAGQSFG